MKTIELKGVERKAFGSKSTKAVRRAGLVPAVIYGGTEGEAHFAIEEKALRAILNTPASYIIEFDIEGKKERGVIRAAQFHPVKDYPMHIDFFRVIEGKPVSIEIPVKIVGNSEGVKAGGKLTVARRKLLVSGLAEHLPDTLEVDITELGIGKSIFVGDLKYDNITLLNPASMAVCAVLITRASRQAAE